MANYHLLILLPGNQLYGQEQALITIAQVLREKGINSHFLIHHRWGKKITDHLDQLQFSWNSLPFGTLWSISLLKKEPLSIFYNISALFLVTLNLYRIIKKKAPTHLLIGNATFSYYLLPYLFLSKIKVIYRHGDEAAQHSSFHRFLNHILFKRTHWHVFNCHYLQKKLEDYIYSTNISVIYNLPLRSISNKKYIKSTSKQKFRILFVGQLAEHKGILILFDAFRSLAKRYPNIILELAGDIPGVGSVRPIYLTKKIEAILDDFPEKVFHYPFQSDLSERYSTADLHICPSIWQEPSANVVFEAKYYAIPSVAFKVGGMSELISHKVDGYLCKNLTSDALTTGIEYFLKNRKNLKAASNNARKHANTMFNVDKFRKQWISILNTSNNQK